MPAMPPTQPTSRARAIGFALIAVGTAFAVLSVLADSLGMSGGGEGFGYQQLIVLIVGIVLILGGFGVVLQSMLGASGSHPRRDAFDLEQ